MPSKASRPPYRPYRNSQVLAFDFLRYYSAKPRSDWAQQGLCEKEAAPTLAADFCGSAPTYGTFAGELAEH